MWLLEGPSANELWWVNGDCGQTADSLGGSPVVWLTCVHSCSHPAIGSRTSFYRLVCLHVF